MSVVAIMGGLSATTRQTHDRETQVLASELSLTTRLTHDRETQVAFGSLSVEEKITAPADAIVRSVSMRHAGVADPDTGERTPFYGVDGDITE